jgi:hypothetical protein
MDQNYVQFCLADRLFYDSPGNVGRDTGGWEQADLPAPEGWTRVVSGPWLMLAPNDATLPAQGWKIHISSRLEDASRAIRVVWDYCVDRRIAFKFLPTRNVLIARNLKYADRSGSGKFITIYPSNEEVLEHTLHELDRALAGVRGPYVLSDLRWADGPLYVRYGGFAERLCRDERHELVPAVTDPTGGLVPDLRQPIFSPPDWVPPPTFLGPSLAARGDGAAPPDFPYRIENVLHYSNGGGVYLAVDTTTNEQVILKEARPHAGLDSRGMDAIARLAREADFLTELADTPQAVRLRDRVTLWEHEFLVEDYIEGSTLWQWLVVEHPLIWAGRDQATIADYTRRVLDILDQTERGLTELHRRGIVYGDLHPNNLIVSPDGEITFIDFEMSIRDGEVAVPNLGAPGFVPLDGRTGIAADRYALACLKMSLFLPLTMLLDFDPGRAEMLLASISERFAVPSDYGDSILRDLAPRPAGPAAPGPAVRALLDTLDDVATPDWAGVRSSLAGAILASARPVRTDRLFPGDIQQFLANGLGIAHGTAGVLYALVTTGHPTDPDHERWLVDRVRAGGSDHQVGFYDGLHGIAHVLDLLGHPDPAAEALDRASAVPFTDLPSDLFSGLAGVGLNLVHFANRYGDAGRTEEALRVADVLAERIGRLPQADIAQIGPDTAPTGRVGLMRGMTGPALFFLRLYEHTDDDRLLDLAEQALAQDLRHCIWHEVEQAVRVNEGRRVLAYLNTGSGGIGLVLKDFLTHRPDTVPATVLTGICRALEPEVMVQPGLFNGRSGVIGVLSRLRTPDWPLDAVIERHLRRLAWHALDYQGHIAFPGEQLLRLSMDLASGNAGVLLALHAALEDGPLLPFLATPVTSPLVAAANQQR